MKVDNSDKKDRFKKMQELCNNMKHVHGCVSCYRPNKPQEKSVRKQLLLATHFEEDANGNVIFEAGKVIGENQRTHATILYKHVGGYWVLLTHYLFRPTKTQTLEVSNDKPGYTGHWQYLDEDGEQIRVSINKGIWELSPTGIPVTRKLLDSIDNRMQVIEGQWGYVHEEA